MLPEGSKTMVALTPGPEDAEKQENSADNLANPTHSLKTIPVDVLARVARTKLQRRRQGSAQVARPGHLRHTGVGGGMTLAHAPSIPNCDPPGAADEGVATRPLAYPPRVSIGPSARLTGVTH